MSSRGRGYSSRGGYGGRGGGGGFAYRGGGSSYRGGGGGGSGRGPFNDRGSRGGFSYGGSSDRYNSGGGGSDRYSSGRNERSDDMGFKKPYRSDGPSNYSSREHVPRASPERKRMRMDESTGGRRSHDGGNHYGGRHDSYSNERRGYVEQRRSPSRDNSYRKNATSMSSPRSPPGIRTRDTSRGARSSAPLRRSFRGRTMRSSRGSFRGAAPRLKSYTHRTALTSRSFYQIRRQHAKLRSALKVKHGSASSSEAEENWESEEKKVTKEETAETPVKSPAKREAEADAGEATDKEAVDAASGEEQEVLPRSKTGRSFIRLTCPHCREKSLTFRVYARHLQSLKHRYVMDDVALKLKFMLQRMRIVQRNAQRLLEDSDSVELSDTAMFCPLCKLNHRTSRQDHYRSECHRNIKKFLTPYCRVCQIALRSPMLYEHHICSLEHIKNKARSDMIASKTGKVKKSGSGDEGMDVDLDNFMTLDSVGDVDEVDDDDSSGEKKNEDGTEKPKAEINVGNEHVKKVEVFYCELCKTYLPRGDDESVLRIHCRMRNHLSRYVRFRDDRTLRRQAERIHRIHQQAKESKKEGKENPSSEKTEKGETVSKPAAPKENGDGAGAADEEGAGEDNLWTDDVDKELGDLLREVNQTDNKYSDDEEDSNVGRYDRFRKSDKKSEIDNANNEESATSEVSAAVKSESESNANPSAEVAAKQ